MTLVETVAEQRGSRVANDGNGSWRVSRVSELAKVISGYPFDSSKFAEEGWPLIRIRDLDGSVTETHFGGDPVGSALVTQDDVLIGMDGDFNIGRWRSARPALLNQRMLALRGPRDLMTVLRHALAEPLQIINDMTYATTVKHLSIGQVRSIRIALPTDPEEMSALARFLDRETAEIDSFIQDQEELIRLLRERRVSTISRAVTRGLNDEVPLRDSGVSWLGAVPASWTVRPLWSMFRKIKDTGHPEEVMLSVFRDHGVVEKGSRENLNKTAENRDIYQLIHPGWLVANRMKAWQGSVGISPSRGIVSGHYICFKPLHSESDAYLNLLFRSRPYADGYGTLSRGVRVGQAEIDNDQYRLLPVLVPPLAEQRQIVASLAEELADIDAMLEDADQSITLSRERRGAIVSAAMAQTLDLHEELGDVA